MTELLGLLHELDQAWTAGSGRPASDWYAPGATEKDIRAALAPITDHPSLEALEWFSWHNGSLDPNSIVRMAPSGLELYDLAGAEPLRQFRIEAAVEAAADLGYVPEFYWGNGWFPIGGNGGGGELAIDVESDPVRCQVWMVDWTDHETFTTPAAYSLADTVRFWLQVVRSEHMSWGDDLPLKWHLDYAATPQEWRNRLL